MPTLSAVVPATNAPPTLQACLAAIAASVDPPDEVLVITEGDGPADARNRGARDASGDVVVFVDADVLPHADVFVRIRLAFEEDPSLSAVFGSYDDHPAADGTVSAFRNLLHHHVHQQAAGPATTFWAGLGAVARAQLLAVGGFDAERYRVPSVEDIDLGTRLAAAGGRITLDPLIQGTHLKAWSLTTMLQTDFSRRGIPWAELVLRDGAHASALNLGWRHRAGAAASVLGAWAFVHGRPLRGALWLGALAALNASFYELLLRRHGPARTAVAVPLHALHHLAGAGGAAVALSRHLRGG